MFWLSQDRSVTLPVCYTAFAAVAIALLTIAALYALAAAFERHMKAPIG